MLNSIDSVENAKELYKAAKPGYARQQKKSNGVRERKVKVKTRSLRKERQSMRSCLVVLLVVLKNVQ